MIAYFGWTNTILFNILNLKQSVYRNEPGHLYVIETDRINGRIIEAVESSGVFEKVVRIKGEIADIADNRSLPGKLRSLFGRSREEAMFLNALAGNVPPEGYDTVVTAAFWSSFLGFYREVLKKSRNTPIILVEEGYANYAGRDYLQRTLICGKAKERVYRIIRYGDIYKKACSSVEANYLYNPEAYMRDDGLKIKRLEPFDLKDPAVDHVFRKLHETQPSYEGRKTVYFAGPDDMLEPDRTEELFRLLPWGRMVYRDRLYGNGKKIIPEGAVTDPARSPVEPVIAYDVDDDSVLIARNSSVLTLPKRMFGKEPWVIFTFGMYNIEKDKLDPLERYAASLRNSYFNKEKVIVANSTDTVSELLNIRGEKHA